MGFKTAFGKEDGGLTVDTQTAYALALKMGLVKEPDKTGQKLAEKVRANGFRLDTGFFGTAALLPALTDTGQNDLAVPLLQSRK